jgi:hypothetical protein
MRLSLTIAAAAVAAGGVLSGAAVAHHSFAAAYDTSPAGAITLTGTIARVRLTNPHSFFFIDVEDENGAVVRWEIEAGTPSGMIRNGYSQDVIQQGDTVTIRGFRARDPGLPSGMLRELETEDGTVYGMFGPQEGPGAGR